MLGIGILLVLTGDAISRGQLFCVLMFPTLSDETIFLHYLHLGVLHDETLPSPWRTEEGYPNLFDVGISVV